MIPFLTREDDALDAAEVVGFHLQRWKIEDFFCVLKSRRRTEFLLFRTAERLQRAIAINAVIAWRIMAMTLLGRETPDCEPELMSADHELDVLQTRAEEHGPAPGHQVMQSGQTRLGARRWAAKSASRQAESMKHALREESSTAVLSSL